MHCLHQTIYNWAKGLEYEAGNTGFCQKPALVCTPTALTVVFLRRQKGTECSTQRTGALSSTVLHS
uniref:Uncharacterized protein n=1 Tax=Anguilla anguilla TaxID=7936 RepID=A0A0E9UY03_ANGAN